MTEGAVVQRAPGIGVPAVLSIVRLVFGLIVTGRGAGRANLLDQEATWAPNLVGLGDDGGAHERGGHWGWCLRPGHVVWAGGRVDLRS